MPTLIDVDPRRSDRLYSQPTWCQQDLVQHQQWKVQIPDAVLALAVTLDQWLTERGATWSSPEARATPIQHLAPLAQVVKDYLTHHTGVVLLSGLDMATYGESVGRLLLCQLGDALGTVMEKRGLLYDVCDRGQDYRKDNVLFSSTQAAPGFHTDSTDAAVMPGLVALMCVRPARSGGESRIVNLLTVYQHLLVHHPQALQRLRQDFIRDKINLNEVGMRPLSARLRNAFPVFEWGRWYPGLTCRYMRYWIEAGHRKAGMPLTGAEIAALDTFEAVANRPEFVYTHRLQPGEILIVNNHLLAHDRTEYEDWEDPAQKRLMIRMWVDNDALVGVESQRGG